MTTPILSIIVPCYYEEEVLPSTIQILISLLNEAIIANEASPESYICLVNDGSQDRTWPLIEQHSRKSKYVRGINLSRNFGHQRALLAGLFNSEADVYVSIDADLQDDESKIRDMLRAYADGYDIVYGVRSDRGCDTFFKRSSAALFYGMRSKLGCQTIPNHADFRLMSKRSVEALKQFKEVNLFLRGVIPLLGFPSCSVFYARKTRMAGESKYPLFKMIKFAWDGIINFSEAPLHIILWIGFIGLLGSIAATIYSITQWYLGNIIPGWTSIFLLTCFFGSFNFVFMGVIGLYLGRIFKETKQRPPFIVQQSTH